MKIGKMTKEVLRNYFNKPATHMYPAESFDMPEKFRGKLRFYPERCIGCKFCMRDCPAEAIVINTLTPPAAPGNVPSSGPAATAAGSAPPPPPAPVKKQFEAVIDNSRCLFCGQCVDVCPKKALESTKDVELAQLDFSKLKVVFRAQPQGPTEKPA